MFPFLRKIIIKLLRLGTLSEEFGDDLTILFGHERLELES